MSDNAYENFDFPTVGESIYSIKYKNRQCLRPHINTPCYRRALRKMQLHKCYGFLYNQLQ